MTDTNAGPVLPELPTPDGEARTAFGVRSVYLRQTMIGYAHQHAEHVAGPLRERVAQLEREEEVTGHVIERTTRLLAECVVILRGPEPPLTKWSYHDIPQLVQALKDDRDRLRAETSYSGMLRGDDKRPNGTTEYTRGWGDCLRAIDAARAARE